MRTDPTPITLDLHVFMTGANSVRKSVVCLVKDDRAEYHSMVRMH